MSNPDPKTLSTGVLISNLIYARMQGHTYSHLAKDYIEEIDRRFPNSSQVLDAGKGEDLSSLETQNFEAASEEDSVLTIVEDFEAIWMKLNRILGHVDSNHLTIEDRHDIVFVMNMFQNRGIIKDSRL
jgi:hypothetical protein